VQPEPHRREPEDEGLDAVAGEVEEPVVEGVDVPGAVPDEPEGAEGRRPAEEERIDLASGDGGLPEEVDGGERLPPAPPRAGEHRGADDVVDVKGGRGSHREPRGGAAREGPAPAPPPSPPHPPPRPPAAASRAAASPPFSSPTSARSET